MTHNEATKWIQQGGLLRVDGDLWVPVTIFDHKAGPYGKDLFSIRPVNGIGSKWVDACRVKPRPEERIG